MHNIKKTSQKITIIAFILLLITQLVQPIVKAAIYDEEKYGEKPDGYIEITDFESDYASQKGTHSYYKYTDEDKVQHVVAVEEMGSEGNIGRYQVTDTINKSKGFLGLGKTTDPDVEKAKENINKNYGNSLGMIEVNKSATSTGTGTTTTTSNVAGTNATGTTSTTSNTSGTGRTNSNSTSSNQTNTSSLSNISTWTETGEDSDFGKYTVTYTYNNDTGELKGALNLDGDSQTYNYRYINENGQFLLDTEGTYLPQLLKQGFSAEEIISQHTDPNTPVNYKIVPYTYNRNNVLYEVCARWNWGICSKWYVRR